MQTYVQRKTEQKRNNLQYIHWFMYIFIYIYLYSNFCSVLNHYILFFFSLVNLQLKVRAHEKRVLGTLVPLVQLSLSLFHLTWKHRLSERDEWLLKQIVSKAWPMLTPFKIFKEQWGAVKQGTQWGDQEYQTCDVELQILMVSSETAKVDVQDVLY